MSSTGPRPDASRLEAAFASQRPVLLPGLVADWPIVQAAQRSARDAIDHLRAFDGGQPITAFLAGPETGGRYFYDDTLQGFNFRAERHHLANVFDFLEKHLDDPGAPSIYVGSTTAETFFPGLIDDAARALAPPDALVSVWLGNRSRIAAHQDLPDNLACVVAGHRRFTLFPPAQLPNLYIGPIDFTPAGQPISLVDFAAPDLQRFPRFAEAMRHAQVFELAPGDALFIPSMWWHHVEALSGFNALVNYWWRRTPPWRDAPIAALMTAILCLRELPEHERTIWRDVFAHYVFDADADVAAHIPADARRVLAPLHEDAARELRARLLQRLNR